MHVSAAAGVQAIAESRARGFPIYGETLHQYLLYTSEDYRKPNGQVYHTYPSLKSRRDQQALWDGLARGELHCVATDEVCCNLAVKVRGRRIGSAKPEWEVFGEVAARVRPERASAVRFASAQAVRDEIARAVPLYAGIERLHERGQSFQWGGKHLYADGRFATADGRARFSCVTPPARRPAPDQLYVSTRRGKQFNSMVQKAVDPLTGAARDDVLIARDDARRLGHDSANKRHAVQPFASAAARHASDV